MTGRVQNLPTTPYPSCGCSEHSGTGRPVHCTSKGISPRNSLHILLLFKVPQYKSLFIQHFNHFPNARIPSLTLISRIKQKLSEQKIPHCFRQYPQGKSQGYRCKYIFTLFSERQSTFSSCLEYVGYLRAQGICKPNYL